MANLDTVSFNESQAYTQDSQHPSPYDLDLYLPWACNQLQCSFVISVSRAAQVEYVSPVQPRKSIKGIRTRKSMSDEDEDDAKANNKVPSAAEVDEEEELVKIHTVYDQAERLVQLKFYKNEYISRTVLQLLGLIIPFQKYLTTITINTGIDMYGIYEISKFLPNSCVTDLILDDTFVKEGNYCVLLEETNLLRRLSLSRCRINDNVVTTIMEKLVHPLPGSKSLMVLDLSTNKITDEGAKYIALMLRTNRALRYLNISDNAITDIGGELILSTLMVFELTSEELISSKQRLLNYYRERNKRVKALLINLKSEEHAKVPPKKSAKDKQAGKKQKSAEKITDVKEKVTETHEINAYFEIDHALHAKACAMAELQLGKFSDPFTKKNLVTRGGVVYCLGNNALCYLNISYNNLSYFSIRKLLDVVQCQKDHDRTPVGLINACIDGNYLPVSSMEVIKIDDILRRGATTPDFSKTAKRRASKTGARPGSVRD